MSTESLWLIFIGNILILWLFLGLVTRIMFHPDRLRRKGYEEAYVEFLRKDNRKRCLGIGMVIPVVELLSAGIVYLIFGGITTFQQFIYICLGTLIGILPFPILDTIKTRKEHKSLALKSRQPVIIDLNYKVWHMIFNPYWEAAAGILVLAYFVWMGEYFDLAMLHLAILWLLYLAGRSGRYLTGPSLSDLYLYNFIFMVFNHLLIVFHLIRFVTRCCPVPGQMEHLVGLLLITAWISKLLLYLVRFPQFRNEINRLIRPRESSGN
jgi:hypothetical protein